MATAPSPTPAAAQGVSTKRIGLNLSESAYADLTRLSAQTGKNMTEIMRLALSVIKIVLIEVQNGNRIMLADKDGKAIREFILPA